MIIPSVPTDEWQRLQALMATGLLDSPPEARFDRLTRIAQSSFGVDIALVSLVDSERQWFKSAQGLGEVCETGREISFCGHAILDSGLLVVEDAHLDPRFFDNPLVLQPPHIRFYAGAPLHTSGGYRIGTLCIIDSKPRTFGAAESELLRIMADTVEEQINQSQLTELRRSLQASESRAQLVIEGAHIGIWQCDMQTGRCEFNERWADMLGYRLAELAPLTFDTWKSRVHPDDVVGATVAMKRHLAGKEPVYECKFRMKHKAGHWVWLQSRGRLFSRDDDGKPLMMYGTHADITTERETLAQLERKNRALQLLNRIAFELDGSLDQQITQALSLGCDYLQLELGIVSEILGEVYAVRWVAAPPEAEIAPGLHFVLEQTYCHLLLQQPGVMAIQHMAHSSFQQAECYRQFGLESYIAIRLLVDGQLFGTLNFSAVAPREWPFDDTDRMFIGLLARWLEDMLGKRAQQERLDKLVEQTPGMLYQYRLWPNGHSAFPYSSSGIEQIYRVSPEAVKENAAVVFERIHGPDLEQVSASIQASERHLAIWHTQYRVVQQDGSLRWVEGRARPERLDDGSTVWHGYLTDIQHEKQAELALADSERRLRGLFELSSIGIALNDFSTGAFIDVNRALLDATGFDKEHLLALDYRVLTPEEYKAADQQALEQLKLHGSYPPYEKEYTRWDGSRFPVRQRGMLVRDAAGKTLLWSFVEDISALKQVEQMQREFVATVSHELRTPLTSITGSLGLLNQGVLGDLPAKAGQMVRVAHNNSKRLNLLINDLLDMEKLVAGKMPFCLQACDLAELIHEAVEMNRPLGKERGVCLEIGTMAAEARVQADRDRLLQALSNLQSNAIKFSPEQGRVLISTEWQGTDRLRILVRDRGDGIPDSFRSRIFQKFAQADSSDTRKKGGTGLGLAITRELLERMGGSVDFESTPGQGSCFWLEIPAAE
ncbi:PAS domain-containing protein [uncultured Oceanisphaera sp.]|uniref:PAS domain-containing protein n=1 Tax=uncultured Oceanisphaera sp. TaxID=353858 RepID=UPI00262C42F9|nr:PAS domain-containing protein [uncultured Oceanisphaera sp.]